VNTIGQGRTFSYLFELTGQDAEQFSVIMNVLQYPGDSPSVQRTVDYSCQDGVCGYIGTLSAVDTSLLEVGEWWIHLTATDSDEVISEPIKLYVTKGWV